MSVERWAVHFTHNPKTGRNDYEGMVRHPVGAYVAYADYKALTAELEAARRDAERYRYLRDKSGDVTTGPFIGIGHQCKQCDWTCGEDADAAIDAALGQTVALVPVPVKEGS